MTKTEALILYALTTLAAAARCQPNVPSEIEDALHTLQRDIKDHQERYNNKT